MFTCIKGGGLPSPHRKILGNHVQYFRSQCSDSNASIPYQCCRWLLPCCFPLTEPNSAVIALIMPQSQPTSIAFTLPMLLPLDPHYSWLWSKCCFFPWIKVLHIHQSRACYRLTAAIIFLSSYVSKQSHIWPSGSFLIYK